MLIVLILSLASIVLVTDMFINMCDVCDEF